MLLAITGCAATTGLGALAATECGLSGGPLDSWTRVACAAGAAAMGALSISLILVRRREPEAATAGDEPPRIGTEPKDRSAANLCAVEALHAVAGPLQRASSILDRVRAEKAKGELVQADVVGVASECRGHLSRIKSVVTQATNALREEARREPHGSEADDVGVAALSVLAIHELNGYLQPVFTSIGLLAEYNRRGVDSEFVDAIDTAARGLDRATTMVARFRDTLTAGRLQPTLTRLEKLLSGLEPTSGAKLTVSRPEKPECIVCDGFWLHQALDNLIRNAGRAARSSAEGVALVRLDITFSHELIRFIIEDNGPGLPAGFSLENRFRAEAAGLGLGLNGALVVAKLHGGTLVGEQGSPGARMILAIPSGPSFDRSSHRQSRN